MDTRLINAVPLHHERDPPGQQEPAERTQHHPVPLRNLVQREEVGLLQAVRILPPPQTLDARASAEEDRGYNTHAVEHHAQAGDPLREVLTNFHTYNRTCKSDQTCLWYEQRLGGFRQWLRRGLGREPVLADYDLDTYRRHVVSLKARRENRLHNPHPTPSGLSPHTVNRHQRALRTFAAFLVAGRYTEHNVLTEERPANMTAAPRCTNI